MPSLAAVEDLKVCFPGRSGEPGTLALDGVHFSVAPGESVGVAGESGSGKSTLARVLSFLQVPSSGRVFWEGREEPVRGLGRRGVGMIFQDALASLNPRIPAGEAVMEPLRLLRGLSKDEARREGRRLLESVGLDPGLGSRYPSELSGGQAQRAALARALAGEPRLLIADEPVSALDVSIQAQVLNLIRDLQEKNGFALVLITHDLSLLPLMCARALVLHQGRLVEEGPPRALLSRPREAYTKTLVAAGRLVPPSSVRA